MQLRELLKRLTYTLVQGSLEEEITDVIYDSRKALPGCVFVCLIGSGVDSHRFAADAVAKGAAAVVASRPVEVGNAALILVDDTREALAYLSAAYFGDPAQSMTTIGITGTKGKTTTTAMIRSILEAQGIPTGTIGTLGILYGDRQIKTANTTPESYEIQRAMREMADAGCRCCVIEASSLGLKWHRTDGFLFDYGIFTNFSHDHIGGVEHPDMEDYLQCKAKLFSQCRMGLVNIDDPAADRITKHHTCLLKTYGCSEEAQLRGSSPSLISTPGCVGVHFQVEGDACFAVDVDIPGLFTVHNALAAIAVCLCMGASPEAVQQGLREVKVKGRVEPVPVPGPYTLLIDYAHNALSMENILTTLREYHPARLITLFGAGGNRPRDRRFEMGEISGRLSDLSVLTEDNSRMEAVEDIIADIETGLKPTGGAYVIIPDRTEAIRYCLTHAREGDIIVLAGKGHEDYQDKNGVKTHYDEREIVAGILRELSESVSAE